jgi:hypothetical protein
MEKNPKWRKIEGLDNDKSDHYGYYVENGTKRADIIRKDWRQWSVYFKLNNKIVPIIHIEEEFKEKYNKDYDSIKEARALAMSWILF